MTAMTPSPPILPPAPRTRRRAELLLGEGQNNGIDYVEVAPVDHTELTVGFILPLPGGSDPWQLHTQPHLIQIDGGEKVRGIGVVDVTVVDSHTLALEVDVAGDWSTYELSIDIPGLDPVLSRIAFSFMASCPSDEDCRGTCEPGPWLEPQPRIDSLAKDYASFRQMLLDLEAQRHPSLTDDHAADLAITILELLAFAGDELSYAQDAAAAEAYLDTARRRMSIRRHTRLVDYVLGEGRNAMAALHVAVREPVTIPTGSRVLTRLPAPLPGTSTPAGPAVNASLLTDAAVTSSPVLTAGRIFETAFQLDADPVNDVLHLHHWGEQTCWLDAGATTVWLWAEPPDGSGVAQQPALDVGDLLVLEEVRSPTTGAATDADPAQRWVVRITAVEAGTDPAYLSAFISTPGAPPTLADRTVAADPALPLLGVRWARADAPTRELCIRTQSPEGDDIADVSLGRGNIVLVDDGVTISSSLDFVDPDDDAGSPGSGAVQPPLRLHLPAGPLTFQIGMLGTERLDLDGDANLAIPALQVAATSGAGRTDIYVPVSDMFDSGPNDLAVVVEVDDHGFGSLRFGDGVLGRMPTDPASFVATYRLGNGSAGNVGAETLAHIALPGPSVAAVTGIRNPLPAQLGTDPESEEHARRIAPDQWKVIQQRAVTEQDAVNAVLPVAGVRAAVAELFWTGSWYTWLVSVLPVDPDDLVDDGGSHEVLSDQLSTAVTAAMDAVRLCGQDVDIRPPEFVAIDLGLHVCASPGQSRSALRQIVRDSLLALQLPDGTPGLLATTTLTFGRPLELGDVYATVAALPGVDSVKATKLTVYNQPDNGELAAGRLDVAPWQVLRIDADPSLPGRGVLELAIDGGTP